MNTIVRKALHLWETTAPPGCSDIHFAVSDPLCRRAVINQILNWGILCGSCVVQLPQIAKILITRSSVGLSAMSYALNAFSGLLFVAYAVSQHIPFTAWGESSFILSQNLVLLILCWRYAPRSVSPLRYIGAVVVYGGVGWYLTSDFFPAQYQSLVALVTTPLLVLAKLPQIIKNARQGHTGQLSLISSTLTFCGNLGRVVTTLSQVQDSLVLAIHILTATLNAMPVLQILWYWRATKAIRVRSRVAQGKKKSQ